MTPITASVVCTGLCARSGFELTDGQLVDCPGDNGACTDGKQAACVCVVNQERIEQAW